MITAQTVFGAFAESAARWPDRPFLNVLPETAEIYGIDTGEITYAEALKTVQDHVAEIEAAGYVKGQRVMVLLENRPSYFLWWLAFNALGISVVPVNPDLRAAEMEYMIGHGEPVLALSLASRADELRSAAEAAKVQMPVVTLGDPLPRAVTTEAIAARTGDAEAALLYTSGTTGQPKGCILTDEYFTEAGRWYSTATGVCALNTDGERMITPLPIFHMNAMAFSFMAMVAVGGCLTALDRFHPRSWWDSVRRSRATCLHYLGVMPSMLMGAEPCAEDRNHSVRFGFGAGIDPKLHAPFEERFGFALTEAWAMTETGAGATICANREPRNVGTSCIGWPQDTVEARLVDDSGADADQGELLVRHAGSDPRKGFFAGYFKNPDATDEAWEGGWFHTGDIVRRAADGTMYFVDRKKNVIRRSGENIAAVEVESVLARHPAIAGVAVAAVPDEIRGDEVFACIIAKDAANPQLAEEITTWCLTQLAYYKAPGYIAFVDELPVTATQKLQRAVLKARAAELLTDPQTVDTRHLKKRSAA
ncbi:AMP-dependent synthetase and ligase [Phaeobacter gallaeciensis]|uniref:AMP-dependent synthetase and ligase n=1 Tax=Phaeobacter gallaeciensis TaxID=60890 RepID=A0A1B0ZX20_9RHOB|nr:MULTISPECIES: AMP-binding protein [Phaeobacter]MEE2632832.1 AMP-binding protein [Pseudomonadota bacterium]ANP38753.1 AMP-dependent synthetase and ligase [Phaeobacter gallaeciensis]MDE4061799.1 AMP-binding protein [Phaeobacter gallaeciensis]MDE4124819.1 AMP-binding protein [Phaeobacter gallaeciensis]MDE4129254.1 AMP-binding protein [Phaeobacter gallaeciensis]